ncbi:MAG TPA: PAS domain-containing protein [Rhizomicrobium sp.]|nr:PAS domain-containing protein [Rhizomicrobium sp.]
MDSQPSAHRIVESADGIASERLKRLFAYWTQLRGTRFAPMRNEINPSDMREQLGWVWLMDVVDGGADFRFRMGGDRAVQYFGHHLAGATLKQIQPQAPQFFGRFFDLVSLCVKQGKPAGAGPSQTAYPPRAFLEVEVLVLPLSDDGSTVTGVIGSIEIVPLTRPVEPRD